MKKITTRFIETVKTKSKRREFADHIVRGLSIRVSDTGTKSWALRYRDASGRQRRMTLGAFPALSLERARAEARKALGLVAADRDPAAEKQAARRAARRARHVNPQTLCDLWLYYQREVLPAKRESTRRYQSWLWTAALNTSLGPVRLQELDRRGIRAAIRDVGDGAPVKANRALALLRHMLAVALDEEMIDANAAAGIGRLYPEASRDRVMTDPEIARLWLALDQVAAKTDAAVSERMCAAIRLVLLTGARAGEVAGLDAAEIDLGNRSWVIPSARFKSKRQHLVPLSDAAFEVLASIYACPAGEWSGPAFPNARAPMEPIRRSSLTRAMKRVCEYANLPRATLHDLRRTTATHLASERIGAAPHVVGAVLGHADTSITAAYNRHHYTTEKRAALVAWSELLARIVAETPNPKANRSR